MNHAGAGLAVLARAIQEFPLFRASFLSEQAELLVTVRGGGRLAHTAAQLSVECLPGNLRANHALARTLLAQDGADGRPEKALLALNLACACLDETSTDDRNKTVVVDDERFWEDLEQTVPEMMTGQLDVQLFTKPRSFEMLREAATNHLIADEEFSDRPCAQIGPNDFGYFKEIVGISWSIEERKAFKLLVKIAKKAGLNSDNLDAWVKSTLANRSISSSLVSLIELLRLDFLRIVQWRDDPNDRAAVVWTARTALAHRLQLFDDLEISGRMAQALWPCPRVWLLVAKSFMKRGALPEFLEQVERILQVIRQVVCVESLEYAPGWILELLAKAVSRHGLAPIAALAGEHLVEVNNLLDKIRAIQSDGCDR
jgi:hypothetical protein